MTTFNTGNPIGSTDSRDRLDNTENMDYLENSTTELTRPDRLGTVRKTRHGMEAEHDAQISAHEVEHDAQMQAFESDFDGRLAGMAFTRVGSFTTGATLTDMRQVLVWEVSQGGDGHEYGWSGTFPKVVAAGATPATSGGIGAGAWVDRTDDTLRSNINIVVKQFACVADMVADTSLQIGDIVETISYYRNGVTGGNKYTISATGTSTQDGGSCINISNSLQAISFYGKLQDIFTWGVIADGIADDSSAIENKLLYDNILSIPENCTLKSSTITLGRKAKISCKDDSSVIIFYENSNLIFGGNGVSIDCGMFIFSGSGSVCMYDTTSNTATYNHSMVNSKFKGVNYAGSSGLKIKGYINTFVNVEINDFEFPLEFMDESNRNSFIGCSIKTYHTGANNDGRACIKSSANAGKGNSFIGCDIEGNPNEYLNLSGGQFSFYGCYFEGHRNADSYTLSGNANVLINGGFYGGLVGLPTVGTSVTFEHVKFGDSIVSVSYPLIQNFKAYSSFGRFFFKNNKTTYTLRHIKTVTANYNYIFSSNTSHANVELFECLEIEAVGYILEAKDLLVVNDVIKFSKKSIWKDRGLFYRYIPSGGGSSTLDFATYREASNFSVIVRFISSDAGAAGIIELDCAVTYTLLNQNKRVIVASNQDASVSIVNNRLILTITNASSSNVVASCEIK